MEHKIDRIENKIDRIESKVDAVAAQGANNEKNLAVTAESVVHHIRRTDAVEAIVLPMKKKLDMVEGVLKFIGIIATIAAAGAALVEIVRFVKGM